MLRKTFDEITSSFMPALAGIRVMLRAEIEQKIKSLMPASAGIRVMLQHQQRKKSKTNQPALAGIRVMSNMKDITKVTNRGACISRYSCNVTLFLCYNAERVDCLH